MKRFFFALLFVVAGSRFATAQSASLAGFYTNGGLSGPWDLRVDIVSVTYGNPTSVTWRITNACDGVPAGTEVSTEPAGGGYLYRNVSGVVEGTWSLNVGQVFRVWFQGQTSVNPDVWTRPGYQTLITGALTAPPPPLPPSGSANKGISMTHTNPSTTEGIWVGIARENALGIVWDVEYVEPGGTYSKLMSVGATDADNYKTVLIDADAAFAAGGGAVGYWEGANGGSNVYDFTGFTTGLGSPKNRTVNGVNIGQTATPGASVPSVSSTAGSSTPGPVAGLKNPNYRNTGTSSPPTVTSATAGSGPTQATQANNTNAITSALADLKASLTGGGATAPTVDMSGVIGAINTVNTTLTNANSKQDANNQTATAIKDAVLAGTTASNSRLDAVATATNAAKTATELTAANVALNTAQLVAMVNSQATGNGKLDALVTAQGAGNGKLDSLVAGQVAGNGKLDAVVSGQAEMVAATNNSTASTAALGVKLDGIKTSVDGLGTKLDTANSHLDDVAKFVKGQGPGQSDYNNATRISDAQAAAGAVSAYTGKKPSVGGALQVGLPSGVDDWGTVRVGNQTLTFGLTHMDPQMDALFVAGRSVLLAAMCLGFMRQASGTVSTYTVALPQVAAQDTGFGPENIGPGISQAKTYATAAVAVGIIFTGAAAIVALVDTFVTYYGGGIASIFAALNFPAGTAFGALDRFVPLAAGLGLTVLGVALPYVVAPLFLGTAAILRFIKT